jgi:RsiW-degrading membrane proteinase PrsW (M82 family)
MNGIWVLLLLLLTATLPAIIVFIWLKSKKSAITLPWFLVSFLAGIISFIVAAMIQMFFDPFRTQGFWTAIFNIFIRIALIEELSRIIVLFPLEKASKKSWTNIAFGAAIGLITGLGFAAIENAYYGLANINITLLRLFTAVPLHAACGIRAGTAVFTVSQHPVKASFLFVSSVFIHGAYNLMIVNPAIPSFLAILIALVALFASFPYLSDADSDSESLSTISP